MYSVRYFLGDRCELVLTRTPASAAQSCAAEFRCRSRQELPGFPSRAHVAAGSCALREAKREENSMRFDEDAVCSVRTAVNTSLYAPDAASLPRTVLPEQTASPRRVAALASGVTFDALVFARAEWGRRNTTLRRALLDAWTVESARPPESRANTGVGTPGASAARPSTRGVTA